MNDSGLRGVGDDAWMDGVRDDSDGTPRVSGFGFGVTARGLGLFSERRVASSRLAFRGGDNGARCVANGMIRTRVGSRSIDRFDRDHPPTPLMDLDLDFDFGERLTVSMFRMYARRARAVAT